MKFHIPALLVLLSACGTEPETGSSAVVPEPRLSSIQSEIFTKSCAFSASCHAAGGQGGCELLPGRSHADLVSRASMQVPSRTLVVPGHPDESFLIAKLRGHLEEGEGERMPLDNPALDESQIQAIEAWIAAGAAND